MIAADQFAKLDRCAMATLGLSEKTSGVFSISVTPFKEDCALDLESIPGLVSYYLRCGVQGITILGVMGEANKLTESESAQVVEHVLQQANGRLPVIVGVSAGSLASTVELARASIARGAAGIMLNPMAGLKDGRAIVDYFARVAGKLGAEGRILVQDYPPGNGGVHLSPETWRSLVATIPQIVALKHEDVPGLQKLSAIRALERNEGLRRTAILVGANAVHLIQELRRGADGVMTGLAFPDLLVRIIDLYRAGQDQAAEDLHDAYLPVMRHESQLAFGLAVRKEMLRQRGAIRCAAVRYPGPQLQEEDRAELRGLLDRLERKIGRLADHHA
jgi:4-hydroxy-tetrahydrodipicolinate synthase